MRHFLAIVSFWWVAVIWPQYAGQYGSWHGNGNMNTVGPFDTKQECEAMQQWLRTDRGPVVVTDCWQTGKKAEQE